MSDIFLGRRSALAKYLTVGFIGRCLPILNIFERSD
jgi:hypothetical protein